MAELIGIEAFNFRAFEHVLIELRRSGLVLVTGANNAGKSALLSLLDVVAGATPVGVTHRGDSGGAVEVTTTWRLDEQERFSVLGELGVDPRLTKFATTAETLDLHFTAVHGSLLPTKLDVIHDGQSITVMGVSRERQFMQRSLPEALRDAGYSPSGGRWYSPGQKQEEVLWFFGVTVRGIVDQWRSNLFHFHALRQADGRTAELRDIGSALAPDGANLATVLLHLQTNAPTVWSRLKNLVREILPNIGELTIPVNGNSCEIVFLPGESLRSERRNLKELGTGVEQLLMLLVVGMTGAARTIVLEDPEIGLHPSAQRALLGLLQEWSQDRLILAATHSAAMLDWSSSSTTVLNVQRQDGASTVSAVTTDRIRVLRDLGIRLSDVLAADRLLVLEGPSDKAVLDVWFAEELRHPRVAVLAGGGGADARQADLLARWLADADQLEERRVLFVRDRDELSEGEVARLEKQGNVFVLPVREVENLLLDAEALARFVNEEQDGAGVAAGQVEAALRVAADALESTVVLKRVLAGLAPVRLADNRLRGELARERADADGVAAAVLERIPLREDVEAGIHRAWAEHAAAVREKWDADWRHLAPGADVLDTVLKGFLGRGYRKGTDGPALARLIRKPPEVLRGVFDAFMVDG
ncbi:AAA family ATPase [Kitasatospora cineracea]|uniref:ATPase n=1 Tax=Kitasatospora cineracea TaxID=88074 RepID=A0A3N4R5A9_9ACTN|nr:AAA family ATPase [Kitasatospora cineracea]RPE27786.1 putative ATPase [Kitasatospora cineracea]